jgi:nucleotide-binding universal stress UspA family protein
MTESMLRHFPVLFDGKLLMIQPPVHNRLQGMTDTQTARHEHEHSSRSTGSTTPASNPVFTNILCAVDGTRTSTEAVRMATTLAGPGGHLTLLAVTAVKGSGAYTTAAITPSRAKRILSSAEHIAEKAGVPATTVVDPGSPPVDVILERARDHDLLVIGAPATSWLGGMLVGGVATVALSQFTTPMLVVRRPFAGSLRGRQVLVASDGEKDSDDIVKLAGRLGQSQGARVTLVNALGAESKMNPHVIQVQARLLKRALPDAGEPYIEPGKAWDVIINAARDTKAATIVMGSRRLGGLRAFGSVSRRVVHDAPCSVLLVPPK